MRSDLFQPTEESEARLLLLIDAFSGPDKSLEGRTKLAKLDFLLRYPAFLRRALKLRGASERALEGIEPVNDIESRMVRYRYGPWDPSHYALLGRLIGKGLAAPVPFARGIGYRATEKGRRIADRLAETPEWKDVAARARLLRAKFDISGSSLVTFIYEAFPEVAGASWGERL